MPVVALEVFVDAPTTFDGDQSEVHPSRPAMLVLPRPSTFGRALIACCWLLPGCSAVLEAPHSTFRDAAATYPLQLSAVFEAPAPQRGARFGDKVVLAGNWLAVTSPFETAAGEPVVPADAPANFVPDGEGVSYLIDTANPKSPPIRVVAPNADPSDSQVPRSTFTFFLDDKQMASVPAASIALDDDWLIVGAAGEDSGRSPDVDHEAQADNGAPNAGAVYVYSRAQLEAGDLTLHQYLKAPEPRAGDVFGVSVALSGSQLFVGAPGADSSEAKDSGAVYVFTLQDERFEFHEYLEPSAPIHSLSGFGASVAVDGERLVVGAPGDKDPTRDASDNPKTPGAGAVYVYRFSDDHWQQQQLLLPSLTQSGTGFGWSVRASDDRIAVGSPFAIGCDDGPLSIPFRGATHIFQRDDSGWALDQCLSTNGGRRGDFFGYSLGLSENYVLIGAGWDASARRDDPTDNSGSFVGAAYLEQHSEDAGWRPALYLKEPEPANEDVFGNAVDLGPELVAVGAEQRSHGATYAGSVYVYRIQSTPLIHSGPPP